MLIGFSMANAMEVEVGTMETNKLTNQFPTNPYFSYSLSQQIYNSIELGMTSGAITSISFYRDWTSENIDELMMSGLKLYMKHTDKSGFDSDTDMIPVEESDLVWTGTLSAPTVDYKGWVTINLDKPFQYDGYNNLVVCFYDPNPAKTTANTNKFYYNATGVNAALTYFSNDVVPDLENINSFSGNKVAMAAHNWMKLTINNYAKIDVIDNTGTDYFPFWSYWKYSLTQQIYTPEELGESKTIKSISFYNTGTGGDKTRKIELYLMHTDNPNFLIPYYNLVNYTDADKVFDGEVTFVSGEWTTINLDVNFNYNSEHNLVITMADNTGADPGGTAFLAYSPGDYHGLYYYSDAYPITLANCGSVTCFQSDKKNKIRINEGSILGEIADASLPTTPSSRFSVSQQLYTSSELNYMPNTISSISFFNKGAEVTRDITLCLRHTDVSQFNHQMDWITHSSGDFTYVFNGKVTFKQGEWTPIRFNKYFDYNGSDNLLVVVDDNTGNTDEAMPSFLVENATDQALLITGDDYNYIPDYLGGYEGVLKPVKNQIRINEKGLSCAPTDINIIEVTWNSASITWESKGSKWNLRYKRMHDETAPWTTVEGLTEPAYQLTGLDEDASYYIQVQTDDNGDLSEWYQVCLYTPERYPCPVIEEVMEVTPYSAILLWTELNGVHAWQLLVRDSEDKEVTVDARSNPFVLTGLKQGESYRVYVRSVIDAENEVYSNWSGDWFDVYTPEANPEPWIVTLEPTPGGADVTWEGGSDSYKLRYRKPTPPETVLFFDDFETGPLTTKGWTTIDEGDTFANWDLAVETTYSGSYSAGSHSMDMYFGAIASDDWLITPLVDLYGEMRYWEFSEASPNNDQYEVLLSTTGNAKEDFTTTLREMAGAYGSWNEVTIDLRPFVEEGQQGYIAFHHVDFAKSYILIDDFGIYQPVPEEPWQEIATKEKAASIEGLEYETEYEVQVLGVMQGQEDVESGISTFTTLAKHPAPMDIAVYTEATTADLTWKGYSDFYEVKYRTAQEVTPFFDDFESGDLTTNGWTVHTLGEYVYDGWWTNPTMGIYYHSGSFGANARSYYGGSPLDADNWLVTPQVDLGGELRYYELSNAGCPDNYEVLLSTTGSDITTDFTTTLREMSPAHLNNYWEQVIIDLSAYEGQKGYIAFHHKDLDKDFLVLDDVGIYQTVYGTEVTKYVTKPEIALKDLTPSTTYEVTITGQKTGEENATSEAILFTTMGTDPASLVLDNRGDNLSDIYANDGVYANVTINNLTLKRGVWTGLTLPFDIDVKSSILKDADVRNIETSGMLGEYFVVDCLWSWTYMYGGYPYLVKWNGESDLVNPTFKGVTITTYKGDFYDSEGNVKMSPGLAGYQGYEVTSDYPGLYIVTNSEEGMLTPMMTGAWHDAFAPELLIAITLPSETTPIILNTGDNDIITGISEINGQWSMDNGQSIYNVAGQRLSKMQKGINIVNGKKVLVK